jgi:folylpolyglutamate synthase/dihydropteroate synthase
LQALARNGINAPTRTFADIGTAYDAACNAAGPEDRVVAFGSFHVVGGILARPH